MAETYNILIAEDEAMIATSILNRLEKMGHHVLTVLESGAEIVTFCQKHAEHVDLILMDIMIDGPLDGIDTAREIMKFCTIPVIYLTAFTDQATLERAKLPNTAGYILKPCTDEDIRTGIELGLYQFNKTQSDKDQQPSALKIRQRPADRKQMIAVWAGEDMCLINRNDICYLEVQDGIVSIHTDKRLYSVRGSLIDWEKKLASSAFFRCHKSFLVNVEKISRLTPAQDNAFVITLNGQHQQIPLSRQRVPQFRKQVCD